MRFFKSRSREENKGKSRMWIFLDDLFLQKFPNEYLIAKFGFDTAENGPFRVWERKTGVQVMRRVRQVTNAACRNIGAQSDNSGGQGIIVPSTGRIYLFLAAVLS